VFQTAIKKSLKYLRMNILILSSKFPFPLKDGGAIATYNLAKGLSETGNDIFILSFNTQKHYINKNEIPENFFEGIQYELVDINTRINVFKALINLLFTRKPFILQRFKSQLFSNKLTAILQQKKFDLIQIEGLYMMQYAKIVKTVSDVIISYRPHNLEHRIWSLLAANSESLFRKNYFTSLSKRIFNYEKSILNSYDIILPISPHDASYFEKLGNSKNLAVVPAGFNIHSYHYQDKTEIYHKLFYIGSLEWIPNQEGITWFINHCWDKLKLKFHTLELHIAGRNTPEWLIKDYSKPGIFWSGEIEDVSDFVKDKTVMIVPLFSGSGLRIKIIEAFLNLKAVVASPIAVEGTGAADNCELLIADGHVDFISKISHLINNEKLFKNIIKSSFDFALENFDNFKISSDLDRLYNQLVTVKKSKENQ
jgi:glycosyltransferase involved in cell wall biosynthesis